MRKRTFLVGSVALLASTLPASAEDLDRLNRGLAARALEEANASILLAYISSVETAVKSGQYTADSLAVAYGNLNAIKNLAKGKTGKTWDTISDRVDDVLELVVNAYYDIDGTDDIATHEKKVHGETISPIIEKWPEDVPES